MRTMIQRAISMLLVAVLLVSYVPTYGFADGASEESYIASNGEVGENSAMDGIVANTSDVEQLQGHGDLEIATLSAEEDAQAEPLSGDEVAATGLSLSETTLMLVEGESCILTAKIEPEGSSGEIEWSSSQSGVAKIDNGVVKAVYMGNTQITARIVGTDIQAICNVEVWGKCGDRARWFADEINEIIKIDGSGSMYDLDDYSEQPWFDYYGYSVVIGREITHIGKHAFDSTGAHDVEIEEGSILESIGEDAFASIYLDSIRLPGTVTSIEDKSLAKVEIHFGGTADQWKNIGYAADNVYVLNENGEEEKYNGNTSGGGDTPPGGGGTEPDKSCGENAVWTFDETTGVLTISGTGDMQDYNPWTNKVPWDDFSPKITEVHISDGITSIGTYSFAYYNTLKSVSIPTSVTHIGASAFQADAQLETIQLENVEEFGNNCFNQSGLVEANLSHAKNVGEGAFSQCPKLARVSLGDAGHSVSTVGKRAFYRCSALADAVFTNVLEIGEYAFAESLLQEADLTTVQSIAGWAFDQCTNLSKVTLGDQLRTIGNSAFAKTKLATVRIPGTITTLDGYIFNGCTALTSAVLESGIEAIPSGLFNGNTSLKEVTLPDTLKSVGDYAFGQCTALEKVNYQGTQWSSVGVAENGNDPLIKLMQEQTVGVTGVKLDQQALKLTLGGEKGTLTATVEPENASNRKVTWRSLDEKIAAVDENGAVTAVSVGTTEIVVKTEDGGYEAKCSVTVERSATAVDFTGFTFTVTNPAVTSDLYKGDQLWIEEQEDGTYQLVAPMYAVSDALSKATLTIQAPSNFEGEFSVSYMVVAGMGQQEGEQTFESTNGVLTIEKYGTLFQSKESPELTFHVGEGTARVVFSLYCTLRVLSIESQDGSEVVSITRTGNDSYSAAVTRGKEYVISADGGVATSWDGITTYISEAGSADETTAEISYAPGDENSKDYNIRISSTRSGMKIADKVYSLHIDVQDAPEKPISFVKYQVYINDEEVELDNFDDGYDEYWYIPRLKQHDRLKIVAVLENADDSTTFEWVRGSGRSEEIIAGEAKAEIIINTDTYKKSAYYFAATAQKGTQKIELPSLEVDRFTVTDLPEPTIRTQPEGGVHPTGSDVSVFAEIEPDFTAYYNFQWYRCDNAEKTNAVAIDGATKYENTQNGAVRSTYAVPATEAGTAWYYCKIYLTYQDVVGPELITDCVKVEISDAVLPLKGDGTSANPYLITSAEDLEAIRKSVEEGNSFLGMYFAFENDVTLPEEWKPIGCTKDGSDRIDSGANLNAFSGIIDGKNCTLTIPAGGLPLLGYVWNASVSNLNIYGPQIDGYGLVNNYHGVGMDGTAIEIDNVTLKTGTQTRKAGLIGAELNDENGLGGASAACTVTIRNCTVESGVVIGYGKDQSMIGAIAGRLHGVIENCKSSATVYGVDYVGGILGCRDNALGLCSVSGCTFDGSVVASGDHAGGIVGGGYTNQTAPNGIKVTANNNTVTGSITGHDKVGGILGGDTYVAQAWNAYSLKANNFSGAVSATGGKYVGGIIGYYKSLNKWDDILGNTYSNTDKGIGFVLYVDTSCETATGMDGTVIFNSGNGTDDLPTVAGCAWRANHNRTDDPLGADADKLCRVAGGSTEPICYELTASGTYKTEYTVGDELDLTGIVLTASWSNGTTTDVALSDVTVDGYDQNKVGIQTITLKYGDAVAYITVTVKPESVKITVAVSILGDEKHGAVDEPHGLARGGLTAWAEDTSVEADTTETVWDVLQRVAKSKDIELDAFYSEQYGTYYIRGVNGLSEKDNGENSGWMYTVNGKHPEVGVSARFVNENDQIILHYTDDYTYEEDGENYGKEPPVTPKPDKANATELLSGKSTTLKVLGKNGKVLGKNDITWTLKDPQDSIYATISATGTVKAKTVLTKHDVTFVGTLKGSYEGTVEQVVTILPKVTQVEIVKDGENVTGKTLSLNAEEGETLTLTAKVYPDELAQEVTWKSSNTKIAQIDAEGTVSFAGKTGTVTVTATSTDGSHISATVKLQVGVLTKSVTIAEPADHTLRSGKSLTLKATTDPVKPTVSGVTFKLVNASDSAYVSVSTSGKVSAKTVNEPHVVKIYAVSKDAAAVESKEITLTILPKNVQSLILKSGDKYVTNGKVVRNVNEELTLKAYTLDTTDGAVEETRDVTWTSSNTKVATIDETGKVTCVKTGTVKLTATADKKTKAAVTLKVTNLVNGITIVTKNDKDSMVVASGKSLALKATVQPANASQKAVTWSMVSGSRYAKISSSGVVSANKGLTSPVTVTVKAVAKDGSGMEATQEITINPVALGVTISDVNHERTTGTLVWNMTEADNIQFSANVYPVKAVQAVTWKSSNAKIAAVDGTGKVTCYKAGTVTITATAKDGSGKKASFKLNIIKKLKSLTLEDQTVEGGKSLQLKAILDPVDPTNKKLTWTVSSNNVGAKISSSGKLTTKKVTKDTKVMVTVSSNDGTGLTATCFVTITPSVKK